MEGGADDSLGGSSAEEWILSVQNLSGSKCQDEKGPDF